MQENGGVGGQRRQREPAGLIAVLALGVIVLAGGERADPATGDPGRGEALYRQYCAVCHGATGQGDGPNAPYLEDDRPRDLTDARYMTRLTDAQLIEVIRGGGEATGRSRFMPAWGHTFSAGQVADLVAYIRILAATRPRATPSAGEPPEAAGARLVAELGCTGCHRIGDLPTTPVAPDLSGIGAKLRRAWLEAFLRRPHRVRPASYVPLSRSRMPDFRLTAEEARRLATYLSGLRPTQAPAPEGALAIAGTDGGMLFQRLACRACHTFAGRGGQAGPDLSAAAQRLQPSWVAQYLLGPQGLDPRSPMPRPGISPGEAWSITTYLFGGAPSQTVGGTDGRDREEAASGTAMFQELACGACHRRPEEEVPERVGPDLTSIGDKLRPGWLAAFLKQPHPIRPWLRARMPGFGLSDTEVEQITAFLAMLRDTTLPPVPHTPQILSVAPRESILAGERLASREYLSCSSCHLGGDREPEGPPEEWAPDLRLAGRRLRPEWIVRWLQDPQRIQPGTKMPSFFSDADSGPNDILDGDEERQILALRAYLLTLGTSSAGTGR
jgi:mono/diheme cytochrome c family protein